MDFNQLTKYLQTQAGKIQSATNVQTVNQIYSELEQQLHQIYDTALEHNQIDQTEHMFLDNSSFRNNINQGNFLRNRLSHVISYLKTTEARHPEKSNLYQRQIIQLQPELSQINDNLYYSYQEVKTKDTNVIFPSGLRIISKQDVLQVINHTLSALNDKKLQRSMIDHQKISQLSNNGAGMNNNQSVTNTNNFSQGTRHVFSKSKRKAHRKNKKHIGIFGRMKHFASYLNSRPSVATANQPTQPSQLHMNNFQMNNRNQNMQSQPNNFGNTNALQNSTNSQTNTVAHRNSPLYNPTKSSFVNSQQNTMTQPNNSLNTFSKAPTQSFSSVQPKSIGFGPTQKSSINDNKLYQSVSASKASVSTSNSLSMVQSESSSIQHERQMLKSIQSEQQQNMNTQKSLKAEQSKASYFASVSAAQSVSKSASLSEKALADSNTSNSISNSYIRSAEKSLSLSVAKSIDNVLNKKSINTSSATSAPSTPSASYTIKNASKSLSMSSMTTQQTLSSASKELTSGSNHNQALSLIEQMAEQASTAKSSASEDVNSMAKKNNSLLNKVRSLTTLSKSNSTSLNNSADIKYKSMSASAHAVSYATSQYADKKASSFAISVKSSALNNINNIKASASSAVSSANSITSTTSDSAQSTINSISNSAGSLNYENDANQHRAKFYRSVAKNYDNYYGSKLDKLVVQMLYMKNLHDSAGQAMKKFTNQSNLDWTSVKPIQDVKTLLKFIHNNK